MLVYFRDVHTYGRSLCGIMRQLVPVLEDSPKIHLLTFVDCGIVPPCFLFCSVHFSKHSFDFAFFLRAYLLVLLYVCKYTSHGHTSCKLLNIIYLKYNCYF